MLRRMEALLMEKLRRSQKVQLRVHGCNSSSSIQSCNHNSLESLINYETDTLGPSLKFATCSLPKRRMLSRTPPVAPRRNSFPPPFFQQADDDNHVTPTEETIGARNRDCAISNEDERAREKSYSPTIVSADVKTQRPADRSRNKATANSSLDITNRDHDSNASNHHHATPPGSTSSTASSSPSFRLLVALPTDRTILCHYQVLLRQSLEFSTATQSDMTISQQGRRQKLRLGQVGLRCKHCAHLAPVFRTKGAANYPRSIAAMYQAAQNIAASHLLTPTRRNNKPCPQVPAVVREVLEKAKISSQTSLVGTTYWVRECKRIGMYERDGAVWISLSSSTPSL